MKIMISHIPHTFNYGTTMMAINLIYYLNKKSEGNIEFYVDTKTKEELNSLIDSIGFENIKINDVLPDKSKLKMTNSDVNLDVNWIDEYCNGIIRNYDSFIVLGGDVLTECYSKDYPAFESYKLDKISQYIPVFLVGQTMGPFTSWRKGYISKKLRNCRIYTRDFLTYEYLTKELGISNVTKSSDLAFLNLPKQKEYNVESLLGKFNIDINQYVTVVPSGLAKSYTSNYDSYIDNWASIIEYITNKKGFKVILLPHVICPEEVDDNIVIKAIMEKIDDKYSDKLIYIDDKLIPLEARLILGNGLFSVSGRMHGAVSSFQMEKPSISLSYSVKYKGVIGEGLGCEDLIVEASDDEKWNEGKVMTETIDKVDYLINNYDDIILKIRGNLVKREEEVINMIDQICKEIGE